MPIDCRGHVCVAIDLENDVYMDAVVSGCLGGGRMLEWPSTCISKELPRGVGEWTRAQITERNKSLCALRCCVLSAPIFCHLCIVQELHHLAEADSTIHDAEKAGDEGIDATSPHEVAMEAVLESEEAATLLVAGIGEASSEVPPLPEDMIPFPLVSVGGASGSSDAVPPPPPPFPLDEVDDGPATITYIVPGSGGQMLVWNKKKRDLIATCKVPGHGPGQCRLTRSTRPPGAKVITAPSHGRPAGFMLAWLLQGHQCKNKKEHYDLVPSHPMRIAARLLLKSSDVGKILLSKEVRKGNPGDESEHEVPPTK